MRMLLLSTVLSVSAVCWLVVLLMLQIRFKSSKFEIRHDEVQQLEVELGALAAPGNSKDIVTVLAASPCTVCIGAKPPQQPMW
jgi:hypothetical protein